MCSEGYLIHTKGSGGASKSYGVRDTETLTDKIIYAFMQLLQYSKRSITYKMAKTNVIKNLDEAAKAFYNELNDEEKSRLYKLAENRLNAKSSNKSQNTYRMHTGQIQRAKSSNELYHHGILKMKWGIRRFQNPDGTLTEAGKERYRKGNKERKERTPMTPEQKKKLIVAGSVAAGATLAAVGAAYLIKSGKLIDYSAIRKANVGKELCKDYFEQFEKANLNNAEITEELRKKFDDVYANYAKKMAAK